MLNIKTSKEYTKRYKEDSKLPSSPSYTYPDDWTTWGHFLQRKKLKKIKGDKKQRKVS